MKFKQKFENTKKVIRNVNQIGTDNKMAKRENPKGQ